MFLLSNQTTDSVVGVLCYDFVTTIHLVVERYWSRPRTWASILFFLNRYTAMIAHAPIFYEFFGLMPELVSQYYMSSSLSPFSSTLLSEVGHMLKALHALTA